MLRLVLRRLALTAPLALGVATLIFVLMETAPGEPVDHYLGESPVPPEVRERLERAYGLDRSPVERYGRWLAALLLRGELGWSSSRQQTVASALRETLPPTLALTGTALVLHLGIGLFLGVVSAARRGSWSDRTVSAASLFVYAMPTFWVGLMAVLVLAGRFGWFPASDMQSVGASAWPWSRRMVDFLWHLALPAGVLGVASAAAMMRFVRAGLLTALGQDFIRAARARGIGARRILWVHALRNALLPVINLVGLSLPVLFSGSLVIEWVFGWPGMGRLTIDAIRAEDVPLVMVCTLLVSVLVVLGNLASDLAMAGVDPRIRLAGSGRAS